MKKISIILFIFILYLIINYIPTLKYNLPLIKTSNTITKESTILEIPKISFKKEFNKNNTNVDIGLWVAKESVFPDTFPSSVIIAAHSGNGSNAYFKNLYKLNIKDQVNLYYHNKIYNYEIFEITTEPKTGTLYLKDSYQNLITLITCTKNDNSSQTIYYGTLKSVNNA